MWICNNYQKIEWFVRGAKSIDTIFFVFVSFSTIDKLYSGNHITQFSKVWEFHFHTNDVNTNLTWRYKSEWHRWQGLLVVNCFVGFGSPCQTSMTNVAASWHSGLHCSPQVVWFIFTKTSELCSISFKRNVPVSDICILDSSLANSHFFFERS